MKKKILICLYAYYPYENANTNVMLPLIKELSKKYEVHIITRNYNNSSLSYEKDKLSIIIHRYKNANKLKKYINIFANLEKKKKRNKIKTLLVNICTPIARFFNKFEMFESSEYKIIKNLMKEFDFEFVLTTCADFDSCRNMLKYKNKSNFNTPWITYFMDPFAYYIENKEVNGDLLRIEKEVYEKSNLIFVTEEIYKENNSNELKPYLSKTIPIQFGNFHLNKSKLTKNIFIPNKTNCVYVGSLFSEKIRDPRLLYRLIDLTDDNIVFHIICNNISNNNKKAFEQMVKKKNKVKWYYNLPLSDCMGIINHADILINIGNTTTNQLPSKVFDYIGTGNPIINLCSIKDDTSKKYLENYPMVLNLYNDQKQDKQSIKQINEFIKANKGKKVQEKILIKEYNRYYSDNVVNKTINEINKILRKEN